MAKKRSKKKADHGGLGTTLYILKHCHALHQNGVSQADIRQALVRAIGFLDWNDDFFDGQ